MTSQNVSTLQLFQTFKPKLKKSFLTHCNGDFIRFLSECIHNILSGVVLMPEDCQLMKFSQEIDQLMKRRKRQQSLSVQRKLSFSTRGLRLIETIYSPVFKHFDHL